MEKGRVRSLDSPNCIKQYLIQQPLALQEQRHRKFYWFYNWILVKICCFFHPPPTGHQRLQLRAVLAPWPSVNPELDINFKCKSTTLNIPGISVRGRCADIPVLLLAKNTHHETQGSFKVHPNHLSREIKGQRERICRLVGRIKRCVLLGLIFGVNVTEQRVCILPVGVGAKGCYRGKSQRLLARPAASWGLHVSVSELVRCTLCRLWLRKSSDCLLRLLKWKIPMVPPSLP